jgi:hypothetical protein
MIARAWKYIDVAAESGCWLWTGAAVNRLYPCMIIPRTRVTVLMHRVLYEHYVEPIEHELHHTCRTTLCVNPWHMEDLTRREHKLQHDPRESFDTCLRGHEPNWHYYGQGRKRTCRTCNAEDARLRRRKRKVLSL